MSIVVLRGLRAHPLRNGIPYTSSTATKELLCGSLHLTGRAFTTSAARYKITPQDHAQWRREAVASLNKGDHLAVPHDTSPSARGGLIGSHCYSPNPQFPRINLDPLPEDVEVDARSKTLDSTRPAPIHVPSQKPDQSKLSYYYSIGRTYWGFYKTGIKNIWANWKEFSEIKGWIQPFTIVACARYGGGQWEKRNIDPATGKRELIPIPHIYRREFALYYRTKHDLWKLLPFSLILVVFGEWTPLVIVALGNRVVPYTCRIPAQQRQSMDDAVARFKTWKTQMRRLTSLSVPDPKHELDYSTPRLEHPWRRDLLFAYLAGQSNIHRPLLPIMSSFYFHVILQKRLNNYWERIFCDTILIRREGGFSKLSPQDIYEYARNYGLVSLFVVMEREVGQKKNYDFVDEELKERLVPILEKEADAMFNDDFTRLKPDLHWARAYRDTTRWANSPDVLAALELMDGRGVECGGDKKDGDTEGQEVWRKKVVEKLNEDFEKK